MRRLAFSCIVLLLAAGGFLYQVRLAEALPSARTAMPLAAGLFLFAVLSTVFAHGRLRVLMAKPWLHYALAAALLAALMVFGRRYRGGLYLPGRINPSEFVKLFFVMFAAGHLANGRNADGRLSVRTLAVQAAAFGLLALEIAVVRDFGLLAQLGLTWTAIVFAASWWWGIAVFAGGGAVAALVLSHPVGHLAVRMAVWRDPFSDATGSGWQTLQGLAALVSGGWLGKGMGLGEVHAVPIVSSDFVYAAVAEETGFLGCAVLVSLWIALLLLALGPHLRGQSPEDDGPLFLAVGLAMSLGIQLFLNIAGVLNALPMTGITLPLLSHGGCSLVAVLAMCGLLNAASSSVRSDLN